LIICKPSVGESTLGPSRINEPEAAILVAHIFGCRFDHVAIKPRCYRSMLSPGLDQLMNGTHSVPVTPHVLSSCALLGKVVAGCFGEMSY
jgi:hypothetical protein